MLDRFTDTSGWAAWADRHEQFHPLALAAVEEVWRQGGCLVTTNWVLAELTALLTRPLRVPKAKQIQLFEDIRADPGVQIIAIDGCSKPLPGICGERGTIRNGRQSTAPASRSCSSAA